jgi:hypothetical protein
MPPELSSLQNVHLDDHPTARSRTLSSTALPSGSVVLSVPALSVVLLPEQKGKRCDACLRLESETIHLRNCSRCHSYWYCGEKCTVSIALSLDSNCFDCLTSTEQASRRSGRRITKRCAKRTIGTLLQRCFKLCLLTKSWILCYYHILSRSYSQTRRRALLLF